MSIPCCWLTINIVVIEGKKRKGKKQLSLVYFAKGFYKAAGVRVRDWFDETLRLHHRQRYHSISYHYYHDHPHRRRRRQYQYYVFWKWSKAEVRNWYDYRFSSGMFFLYIIIMTSIAGVVYRHFKRLCFAGKTTERWISSGKKVEFLSPFQLHFFLNFYPPLWRISIMCKSFSIHYSLNLAIYLYKTDSFPLIGLIIQLYCRCFCPLADVWVKVCVYHDWWWLHHYYCLGLYHYHAIFSVECCKHFCKHASFYTRIKVSSRKMKPKYFRRQGVYIQDAHI